MSTNTKQEDVVYRIELLPEPKTYTIYTTHPIFFYHKCHRRIVKVEPTLRLNTFKAKYTDPRIGKIFLNRESAEYYLNIKIPEPFYVGELITERCRDVYAYYVCTGCGHVDCEKIRMTFAGPGIVVDGPISASALLPCPHCRHLTLIEITTKACLPLPSNIDCDWVEKALLLDKIKR